MIGTPSIKITHSTTLLFGLILYGWLGAALAASADSELSGYVYTDLNIDGFFDPSEAGVAEVEVVLTKPSDPNFSITMRSHQSGYYEFTGLDAGVYAITQPMLPLGVRNVFVRAGELRDSVTDDPLLANAGSAVLLDQSQGFLPHVEGIQLPDQARGTGYNFGQIYLGKANYIIYKTCPIPEPSSGLLLAFGGLLLGTFGRRGGRG